MAELKDMYPSLMQSILQHDKRMFGVPFRSTLFKASKLVEVLRTTIRQQGNVTDSELPRDPFDSDEETTPRPVGWAKSYTAPISNYTKSPITLASAATFCDSTGITLEYGSHTRRRKSLDDASGDGKSFSDGSNKGVARRGLFRGGFAKKKSLNDLKACSLAAIQGIEIPPVPKLDPKYCDATDLSIEGNSDEVLYDARAGRCRT